MLPASFKYSGHRNSYTELNCLYFWTITIKEWIHLLLNDDYKNIMIGSLQWLCNKELIRIYGLSRLRRDAQSPAPFVEPVGHERKGISKK